VIRERRYQPATQKQLEDCIRWLQNYLNLRDWQIEFHEGTRDEKDLAPGWTLISHYDALHYQAEVWTDLNECEKNDLNPFSGLCHELIHVLVMGKCRLGSVEGDETDEAINYALQDALYLAFCRDTKKKVVGFQKT
jgi:hypothetical protein